jgi:hypothetical protein
VIQAYEAKWHTHYGGVVLKPRAEAG